MIMGTKTAVSELGQTILTRSHLCALLIADNPKWNVELRSTIVCFVNSFSTPQIPLLQREKQVENFVVLMSSFGLGTDY